MWLPRAKYIYRNGRVEGYYSGYTFANQLGITTRVPYVVEIVSNNASSRFREIDMKGRKIVLRKSRIIITRKKLSYFTAVRFVEQYHAIRR